MANGQDFFGAQENRAHDDLLRSIMVSFFHARSFFIGLMLALGLLAVYWAAWKTSAVVSAVPVVSGVTLSDIERVTKNAQNEALLKCFELGLVGCSKK